MQRLPHIVTIVGVLACVAFARFSWMPQAESVEVRDEPVVHRVDETQDTADFKHLDKVLALVEERTSVGGEEEVACDAEEAPAPPLFVLRDTAPITALGIAEWTPTEERAKRWVLQSCDDEAWVLAWNTDGFKETYAECCEHWALRQFVIDYQDRENERYAKGQPSVPLADELQPVTGFLVAAFGTDIWQRIDRYGEEVIDALRNSGEAEDDVPSKWALFSDLKGAACFQTLEETLTLLCID